MKKNLNSNRVKLTHRPYRQLLIRRRMSYAKLIKIFTNGF